MKNKARTRLVASALLVGALTTVCSGCSYNSPSVWVEDQRSLTLTPANANALKAITRNGHVNVVADAGATDIRVDIHIKAGGRDEADAAECLEAIDIRTPFNGGTQVIESAWKTMKRDHWGSAISYDIVAPPHLAVDVDTRNGKVGIKDMTAAIAILTRNGTVNVEGGGDVLKIDTRNGEVDVDTPAQEVNIVTRNGAIDVRMTATGKITGHIGTRNGRVIIDLAEGASSEVSVSTRNGKIKDDTGLKNVSIDDNTLRGILGDGGGHLTVETRNGSVTLQ